MGSEGVDDVNKIDNQPPIMFLQVLTLHLLTLPTYIIQNC